jgi:hypothetical protein
MADSGFDGLPGLAGEIGAVVLIDNSIPANNVVDADQPFQVRVSWRVRPAVVATVLDGTWTVDLYAESMGPGSEIKAGSVNVAATGVTTYTATITVPVGRLTTESNPAPTSGVYKLVEVLTYRNRLGTKSEIAAFSEGPTFLLREP